MNYTPVEKEVLSLMNRTDFKHISKSDIISITSKISELRPEVAKEVLAQFPEFVGLMKMAISEYKTMVDFIVKSDDESIKEYYDIANKEMDQAACSRKEIYEFAKQVQSDCSKLLDNPNLPPEVMMEILNREIELVKVVNEKDSEIRQQERAIEDSVNKKDGEKREFNWELVRTVGTALAACACVGIMLLGGKADIKIPKLPKK